MNKIVSNNYHHNYNFYYDNNNHLNRDNIHRNQIHRLNLKNDNKDPDNDDYQLRDYESMGLFNSFAKYIDKKTGGFALQYADVTPYNTTDPVGLTFLATNLFYIVSGIDIVYNNQYYYGGIIETAGLISFYYHYNQLYYGPDRTEVRIALLIDYICASFAIISTMYQCTNVFLLIHIVPFKALILGIIGVLFLLLSWKYEKGLPYIIFHGTWHIFSALSTSEVVSNTY